MLLILENLILPFTLKYIYTFTICVNDVFSRTIKPKYSNKIEVKDNACFNRQI